MERKERVLSYIKSKEYIPLKFDELMVVLDVPEDSRDEFSKIIKQLEFEGKIVSTKKGRYIPSEDTFSGVLLCAKNGKFGFVKLDDENAGDVYIDRSKMGTALHSDRVLIKIEDKKVRGESREGRILRVLERNLKTVTGVIEKAAHDCFYVIPDDTRVFARLRVNSGNLADAENGDRVLAEITRYDESGHLSGKVIKSLGNALSLKSLIEAVIEENKIKTVFNEETLEEAQKIPSEIGEYSDRLDLTEKTIFTIDGETARDFDDAVSIERSEKGNSVLGVHIADVSHYVTLNSALDEEAFMRGTSVYLPDRVIPMLPEKLSNGICSLNPNVKRFTLSVFMEIDENGDVVSHSIHKSVIKSKCRMTYERVNAILEQGIEPCEYAPFLDDLKEMEKLAQILHKRRVKRGSIEFDFPETKILTDINGEPTEVATLQRGVSNRMIEEFMLIANETVAEFAFWSELPFVYRVHSSPSEEKIAAFNLFLKPFGLSIKGKIDKDNPIRPKALEQIMDKVKGTPEERIVAKNMLRSLMKAEYKSENDGHFGLAAKYYCHFTSPIRRYPDLFIHRVLKLFLDGKTDTEEFSLLTGFSKSASKQSSECEQMAENAERDVDDLMKTAYMQRFLGEQFFGVVSGVTNFGIFAELENGVEGIIRLENLTDDYYEYNETLMSLTGKATGRTYKIGDCLDVTLVRCDLLSRRIEFVRTEDVSFELMRKMRRPQRNRAQRRKTHKRRR